MMSARGPRSKMSPTTWRWSTARRLMSSQSCTRKLEARPMSMMVEMMFS
ncbi:Uncharacterised protein [Flavonifractor plautii]|uniref:Uncharacterized protein n=1 Tax=Flavonifractor plautii TaxID=292800 RepID=A0A174L7G5_FLAPL|nr:Uncharacterised protein [Flavonifractor plautii]